METKIATFSAAKNLQNNFTTNDKKSQVVLLSFIPKELKNIPQWIYWKNENGRKIPLDTNYRKCDATNPENGVSFEEIVKGLNYEIVNGIGFILSNRIVTLDVDNCINETGEFNAIATELLTDVDLQNTYIEYSQSGQGLHFIYIDDTIIGNKNPKLNIEIYSYKRYFAITGNKLSTAPNEIKELKGITNRIIKKYFHIRRKSIIKESDTTFKCTNEDVLHRAELIGDKKFLKLFYEGNLEDYNGDHSSADTGLMCKLYTYTGGCIPQMLELFSQSALGKRDKWYRPDYPQRVLTEAVSFMESCKNPTDDARNYIESVLIGDTIEISDKLIESVAICKFNKISDALYYEVRDRIKASKCSLRKFDSLIKEKIQELIEKERTNNFNAEYPIVLPENITFDWKNHRTLLYTKDGGKRVLFDSINIITHRYINVDTNYITLTVGTLSYKSDKWKYTTGGRDIFFNPRSILSLSGQGLDVAGDTAKDMVYYLHKFESLNTIPSTTTVSQSGWIGEEFVYPNYTQTYEIDSSVKKPLEKIFTTSGTIEKVLPLIIELKLNPIPNMVLGIALSAPLIRLVNGDNNVLHIFGNAGTGKTTLTDLAFSLYGNPNIKTNNPTADTTKVGLENYFAGRRDLLAVVEDLNTASDIKTQKLLEKIPYQFGNGIGRLRGKKTGGNDTLVEFRGTLITNGEKPITSDTSEGGGKRRVIELQLTEPLFTPIQANEIYNILRDNYGLFGYTWIQFLKGIGKTNLCKLYDTIVTQLLKEFPMKSPRHMRIVASAIVANVYFSNKFLNVSLDVVIDKEYKIACKVVELLPTQQSISDYERAKNYIIDWIFSHPKNFYTDYETTNMGIELYGVRRNNVTYIFPTILSSILKTAGFAPEVIIKQWSVDGFLIKDSGQLTKKITLNGSRVRMYALDI